MFSVWVELEDGEIMKVAGNLSAERAETLQEEMECSGNWQDAYAIWVENGFEDLEDCT